MSRPDREEDFRLAGDDPMIEQVERMTASRAKAAAEASRAKPSPGEAPTAAAGTDADEAVGAGGVVPADPFEPDASQ
jgi:hypothetical protein